MASLGLVRCSRLQRTTFWPGRLAAACIWCSSSKMVVWPGHCQNPLFCRFVLFIIFITAIWLTPDFLHSYHRRNFGASIQQASPPSVNPWVLWSIFCNGIIAKKIKFPAKNALCDHQISTFLSSFNSPSSQNSNDVSSIPMVPLVAEILRWDASFAWNWLCLGPLLFSSGTDFAAW